MLVVNIRFVLIPFTSLHKKQAGAGRQAAENCHINKPSHKQKSTYYIPSLRGSGTISEGGVKDFKSQES